MSYGRSKAKRYTQPNFTNTSAGILNRRLSKKQLAAIRKQKAADEAAIAAQQIERRAAVLAAFRNANPMQNQLRAEAATRLVLGRVEALADTGLAVAVKAALTSRQAGEPTLAEIVREAREAGVYKHLSTKAIMERYLRMKAIHAAEDMAAADKPLPATIEQRTGTRLHQWRQELGVIGGGFGATPPAKKGPHSTPSQRGSRRTALLADAITRDKVRQTQPSAVAVAFFALNAS